LRSDIERTQAISRLFPTHGSIDLPPDYLVFIVSKERYTGNTKSNLDTPRSLDFTLFSKYGTKY
jgi:hypothetical protein